MMPTTYASLAVLTALAPLVAPQPQDDFALASFDVSGCELLWDGGLDEHYVGTPYTDYEFFSGVRAGAGASLKTLNASAVSDVLLNASGAFDGKKSSDFAVVSPPNSKQFFLRAPQGSLAAVERNLAAMQAATAPERALVIERWTAALDSPQLSGGLLDAQAWAALSAGGSLTPAGRWQSQLTPGATAFVDVEIAHNSFAFDEITFSATHGARGFARYGGGLGGGWLRVSFEFNAPVGDLRRTDFGGGGMLSDKDSASERKLGLSVESRDVLTDGFQIAGFLPKGGAYLIGLGTAKGGTRAVWYSVRVAGEGVEGVHRLTSESRGRASPDFRERVEDHLAGGERGLLVERLRPLGNRALRLPGRRGVVHGEHAPGERGRPDEHPGPGPGGRSPRRPLPGHRSRRAQRRGAGRAAAGGERRASDLGPRTVGRRSGTD
jgi:hypothetical protein